MPTPYTLEAPPDHYWEALGAMKEGHQERVLKFIKDHALHTPTTPIPGSLKQLHGEWKGYWQYTVSMSDGLRLIYTVNDETKTVRIEYLGAHPSWSRTKDGSNL